MNSMPCVSLVIARFCMVALFLIPMCSTAMAQEQTTDQFKKYVAGKLDGLSDANLAAIADAVDVDGDGKISEAEFENRMKGVQAAMSGAGASGDEPAKKRPEEKAPDEVMANNVVVLPPIVNSPDAQILLITGDEIAKAWVPFARWKTQNGKLTKIITVGQIAKKYEANSIQEKIRLCVRQHIENHKTKWVILGGDCLPGGKGVVPGGHTTVHKGEPDGIPTDIVYLSPTDWDADDDGIYGEFDDDRDAISYPDGSVGLGRIPVRTVEDVAAFTEKVIAYESKYPTDKFATNMIYTCTDAPAYPKVRKSWDSYVSNVWNGEVGRFFTDETPWDKEDESGSHDLSAKNLVGLFNQKTTGKIHIHGHGHLPAWVLEGSSFSATNVAQLENNNAYPLITTVSCNTGEYDSMQDPSIVERMLRAPNAGSVAIVAPVRTGKPHFAKASDFRLMMTEGKLDGTTMTMTNYWSFGLGEGATTGHAMMKAKQAIAKDAAKVKNFHLCICELNLLGDPTLDMRAKTPRTPALKCESTMADSKTRVVITTDAPGSTVCLWDSKDSYFVATADGDGKSEFVIEADASKYMATVSGPSLNSVSSKVAGN